ncbi:Membrane protein with HlyD domain [Rubrivivax sp. A210]|uniref:HlyD family efflux transporter periplasmic adaptor subunit n=1 Tax=Rubrivivax sp. A210 TaxID=2772301 RepID=UPI00191AAE5F|nr:HlyD family efflux transporter periplasmic adaptor subunit [Rubrivivax sp. A210]CAD5372808.1 Membrane protein with HlyD domain [Rubrivivax sp. A210]
MNAAAAMPWPPLREELRLHEGPADRAGHPTWTLHDPVRHRFLRIDWTTFEILRRWWLGDAQLIAEAVNQHSALQVDADDVGEVLALALREELAQAPAPPRATVTGQQGLRGAARWLLHHYLFFRIPLLRPDRGLQQLLPLLRGLGSGVFTAATVLALVGGLFGMLQHAEALRAQWLDLLSWQGLLLYGATLIAVKLAHELGHALVAKHHGCRVPTMGVAFMVMWPMAYTDTTEAWKLSSARARMQIAAAGVRTELAIAAWASLAWGLLPEGPARTAAFVLSTTSWLSTVFVNLSPFMRFDGYFLLCDALELPNLHERSFALTRHALRAALLGWQAPPPEHFEPPLRRALIAFGLVTWAWRLGLYLGIALTVYAFGFKLLGLFLMAVELAWFISMPVLRELAVWRKGWQEWHGRPRAWLSALWLALLGAALCLPWQRAVTGAALLQPAQHLALQLPAPALLTALHVQPGQAVQAGQVLLRASTPGLERQAAGVRATLHRLETEVAAASLGGEQQGRWASLQSELRMARDEAAAIETELARYAPRAPFDGVVVDMLPGLAAGQMSPPARQNLLQLAGAARWLAVAYVDEETARALQAGQTAALGVDAEPLRRWPARVASVAPQPSVPLPEAVLVQAHGGLIDARETAAGWVPLRAQYRVELELDAAPPLALRAWRGHVRLQGAEQSLAGQAWRALRAVWLREAGF